MNTAVGLLKSLIDFVQQKRDKFDHFECCGVERVGHEEYKAEKKRVCRRNVRWDIGTGEEALLQPRERFKEEVFVPIIDNLLSALRHRLNAYEAVYAYFRFLSNLSTSSSNDITVAADRLVHAYPEDLESDLADELIQFVSFIKSAEGQHALIISPNEPEVKCSNELRMYLFAHRA